MTICADSGNRQPVAKDALAWSSCLFTTTLGAPLNRIAGAARKNEACVSQDSGFR
jgi:hypothetical protein